MLSNSPVQDIPVQDGGCCCNRAGVVDNNVSHFAQRGPFRPAFEPKTISLSIWHYVRCHHSRDEFLQTLNGSWRQRKIPLLCLEVIGAAPVHRGKTYAFRFP